MESTFDQKTRSLAVLDADVSAIDFQEEDREHSRIPVNVSAIVGLLGTVALLLVLADIVGQFSKFILGHDYLRGFVPLFDLDEERNIPTYFSVLLMLSTSLLLAAITVLNKMRKSRHLLKWAILSVGFLSMGFDEAFQVHESLTGPVRAAFGTNLGTFYSGWVIPAIGIVLVLGVFFLRFLLDLPSKTSLRFLLAASIYLGGCIGVELIESPYMHRTDIARETHMRAVNGGETFKFAMIVALEEGLEMTGMIVFIWALLKYCADNYKEVRFQFEVPSNTAFESK